MKTLKEIILETKKPSSIDDYIQEKLKIGSKSKVDANDNLDLLKEILYVLSINDKNPLQYPKDRLDFIKEEIQHWISKNNVKNVIYYADQNTLEIYNDYYITNLNILNYFDKKYDITKEIHKENIKNIYSNDYCSIKSSENLFIIHIQEPTHQIYLDFYIIKTNEED